MNYATQENSCFDFSSSAFANILYYKVRRNNSKYIYPNIYVTFLYIVFIIYAVYIHVIEYCQYIYTFTWLHTSWYLRTIFWQKCFLPKELRRHIYLFYFLFFQNIALSTCNPSVYQKLVQLLQGSVFKFDARFVTNRHTRQGKEKL